MFHKRVLAILTALLLSIGLSAALSPPANATSQTCISATGGYVCTIVYGSGTNVSSVGVSRGKGQSAICNYSAWFFYAPPSGGAFGLGSQSRAGCVIGRAWFEQPVGRSFASGTQVCAKFYENNWSNLIGEKCVGV